MDICFIVLLLYKIRKVFGYQSKQVLVICSYFNDGLVL